MFRKLLRRTGFAASSALVTVCLTAGGASAQTTSTVSGTTSTSLGGATSTSLGGSTSTSLGGSTSTSLGGSTSSTIGGATTSTIAGATTSTIPGATTSTTLPALQAGLLGHYCGNANFTAFKFDRIDPQVRFFWGPGAPGPKMGPDTFSVRWTGYIKVPTTGNYRFYTVSDDGVKLFINNVKVIGNWPAHSLMENASGKIPLTAGQFVPIKLEYWENTGSATMILRWSGPGIAKGPIPASAFWTAAGPVTSTTLTTGSTSTSTNSSSTSTNSNTTSTVSSSTVTVNSSTTSSTLLTTTTTLP